MEYVKEFLSGQMIMYQSRDQQIAYVLGIFELWNAFKILNNTSKGKNQDYVGVGSAVPSVAFKDDTFKSVWVTMILFLGMQR